MERVGVMEFFDIPLLEGLKSRMHWHNKRQQVLSENVANANTPRYTAQRMQGQNFTQLLDKTGALGNNATPTMPTVRMVASHPGHMVPPGDAFGALQAVETKAGQETPNGNNVELEEELRRVGENQMEYGLMINLYRKHSGLLKMAIGSGGGAR
ncbi:flagellar basal-body rod protein FlgB [Rhodothalassium salexigens DSM 2132]|uniref:Flagellar basal body rod protein FlgB n=2 Tax=Rhodothalassium salexigens TaxID=1086 RepID=A0A4R2PDP3_RHOSA|nr:flagellar basal-body rod protein FlgB [Rhodothalassium salexigens DSM 2132]